MRPLVLLPLLSALLSLGFAVVLGIRFAQRRRSYHAVWAFALVCFGISTAAQAAGAASGWTETTYRWWYLCGAVCAAAYLGAGSLYLHSQAAVAWLTIASIGLGSVPALGSGFLLEGVCGMGAAGLLAGVLLAGRARFADAALGVLVLGTVVAATRVLNAPLDVSQLPLAEQIATGQAFPAEVRILTPMFNIPGALLLLLGAVVSAVHFWQRRGAATRVAANVLIVLGAFIPSLASSLTRFGDSSELYIGQLVGVLCLLGGFILSEASARPRPHPSA